MLKWCRLLTNLDKIDLFQHSQRRLTKTNPCFGRDEFNGLC